MLEFLPSLSTMSDHIGDMIGTTLNNTIGRVLYMIVSGVNWFISVVYQLFEVFSGQIKVSYKGETNFLTNIFFENSTIAGIYWGMAIIGVVLCFAFTIIAVIRKMFDGAEKMQTTLGAILGSAFKSILLILSLNVVMVFVLNFSNVLMQRMVYVFNAGSSLTEEHEINFTDDQFATMGRVLNTIGNYSLNPSYNSRYNLNSCFNAIRSDMLALQQQGVFDFYYITKDENGEEIETWQSALQSLVFVANLNEELKMDVYNEGVSNALLEIMEILDSNTAFYPLDHYSRSAAPLNNILFDRVLFLGCTYNAAINEEFNVNPSHTDILRGPYYSGEKSIYDFDQVVKDFNLLWGFNYIVFFLIVYGIFKEMNYILVDCVARIYNMVVLYLLAPPFIAISPLDGGGKMKQWMTAFVVQCFGVFGTVVAMRLLITFAPIIISTDLEIFADPVMDILAKYIMIDAGCMAARKASAMFTGILADSAGWQSITAGNLRSDIDNRKKEEQAESDRAQAANDRAEQRDQRMKQNMAAAKSAAKLAAGGGNMKDVKNVGGAVKNEMKDKGVGGPNGGKPPVSGGPTGGKQPQNSGGPTGSKQPQGSGGPTGGKQPQSSGGPTGSKQPQSVGGPTGSKQPQGVGGPNGSKQPQGSGGNNNGGNTNGGNIDNNNTGNGFADNGGGDGFYGIPVAPDITQTRHYDSANDPYRQQEVQQGGPQNPPQNNQEPNPNDPPKNPPPPQNPNNNN